MVKYTIFQAFGVQCLSGTGGLRVGAEFLARVLKYSVFYFSKPTWGKTTLINCVIDIKNFLRR